MNDPYACECGERMAKRSSRIDRETGLLERYLGGELDDREFEFAYTTTLRDDASLRSREEVEVLGSIFGDVDRHMEMHMMMGGRSNSDVVRQRAAAALEGLRALA